jgi:hypothetical protein
VREVDLARVRDLHRSTAHVDRDGRLLHCHAGRISDTLRA